MRQAGRAVHTYTRPEGWAYNALTSSGPRALLDFPLKNALAIVSVTLSALLAGCAGLQKQPASTPDDKAPPTLGQAAPAASVPAPAHPPIADGEAAADPSLPTVRLTEELMYKILAAEIASQRGQWQSAYVTLLSVAQQTRDPRLARRAAEVALSVKQSNEALAAIRLWRELAPDSEEATQYLLGFLLIGDRIAEARPIFEKRLKEARPATRGLMIYQMQRMLARARDRDGALAMLKEVLAPYAGMPEAHIALAQAAHQHGDAVGARAEAREALRIKPDSEIAALTLAQVTPDKTEAMQSLDAFLKANPASRDVRVAYARMLVEQKQNDRARVEFETVLRTRPEDLGSLYALGVLSAQANDIPAAEKYLTSYIDVLTRNPDEDRDPTQALLLLAQIAEDRKDTEGALRWLARIESGDGWLLAQIKQAQIMARRGDLAGARRHLQALKPEGEREQAQLLIAEAQLLRDATQHAAAMQVLEGGLARFPDNTDMLYDYAMLAEKTERHDVMEKSLRRIIELSPTNQHAYNALGYSLAERNIRLDEARALIEKALTLAPDDPFIMDSMGWVLFRLGKLNEAEDLLRRAYALRPDPEIATHLGEVLWTKGQKEAAQQFWRDASKKDPQNDTLRSTLTRLHVSL